VAHTYQVKVVDPIMIPTAAHKVPTFRAVGNEQNRPRRLKNVLADDHAQIGWREFHEA